MSLSTRSPARLATTTAHAVTARSWSSEEMPLACQDPRAPIAAPAARRDSEQVERRRLSQRVSAALFGFTDEHQRQEDDCVIMT